MNRRDVVTGLLLGAVVGGTVWAPARAGAMAGAAADVAAGAAAGAAQTAALPMGRNIVVFDSRFAAARQFSDALTHGGWTAQGFSGDPTSLWHQLLDTQWHRHTVAMQGMTRPDAFLCLQQLAADRFWRPTSIEPAGELIHWALAPRSIPS